MSNFTHSAITTAFGSMLERMSFDKITVSGLTKECGISRNTFYYHFRDIYDLLDHWLEQMLSSCTINVGEDDWKERIRLILNYCKEHKKLVYNLSNSISRERLERYFFTSTDHVITKFVEKKAGDKDLPPARMTATIDLCRYACMGCFLHFLWNGMKEDTDQVFEEVIVLVEAAVAFGIGEYSP